MIKKLKLFSKPNEINNNCIYSKEEYEKLLNNDFTKTILKNERPYLINFSLDRYIDLNKPLHDVKFETVIANEFLNGNKCKNKVVGKFPTTFK